MGRPTEDIAVEVLRGPDPEYETSWPARRRRRWSAVLVALLVVAMAIGGPVTVERSTEEAAPPATGTAAPGGCPHVETRRLWCSFVTDDRCCPSRARPLPQPSGVRTAAPDGDVGEAT